LFPNIGSIAITITTVAHKNIWIQKTRNDGDLASTWMEKEDNVQIVILLKILKINDILLIRINTIKRTDEAVIIFIQVELKCGDIMVLALFNIQPDMNFPFSANVCPIIKRIKNRKLFKYLVVFIIFSSLYITK
jgi:hypothetical protein